MRVITIKRTIRKSGKTDASPERRSIREVSRLFFAAENHLEFAIEALFFAVLLGAVAWPIVAAAGAIGAVLQHAAI